MLATAKAMGRFEKLLNYHNSESGMSKTYSAKDFKKRSKKRKEARRSRRNNR